MKKKNETDEILEEIYKIREQNAKDANYDLDLLSKNSAERAAKYIKETSIVFHQRKKTKQIIAYK